MEHPCQLPNERMKHLPLPIPTLVSDHSRHNSVETDLLWISKHQQQHPATLMHPLKNTIRLSSDGRRHKFDGKQWRALCKSNDGQECRNLAFRNFLCQKHFYKLHIFRRNCGTNVLLTVSTNKETANSFKRSISPFHDGRPTKSCIINSEVDQESFRITENEQLISRVNTNSSDLKFNYFSIDCDSPETESQNITDIKSEPVISLFDIKQPKSNESEKSLVCRQTSKISQSIQLGLPPLTRTEEKALANEIIKQLPANVTFKIAEKMARRRACEIISDNYSQNLSSTDVAPDWFYDFLLRNPRVPIHFQSWFSSIKSTIPSSDCLVDIKIWELGLVTRSIMPSSSISPSLSSS